MAHTDVLAGAERLADVAERHTLGTPCNIRGCTRDGVWGFGGVYPSPLMWFCVEHEPSAEAKRVALAALKTGMSLRQAAHGLLRASHTDIAPEPGPAAQPAPALQADAVDERGPPPKRRTSPAADDGQGALF